MSSNIPNKKILDEEHISNSDDEDDLEKKIAEKIQQVKNEMKKHCSKTDKDNDNDIMNEIDEDDVEMKPVKESKKMNKNHNVEIALEHITTDGASADELANVGSDILKSLIHCTFCNFYYKQDMIVPFQKNDDNNNNNNNKNNKNNDEQCWHCFYWMNYGSRKEVDGKYGNTIGDYIIKCKDVHEMNKCTRNSDSGGCFLCEYNLGLPITDVIGIEKLKKLDGTLPDKPSEDDHFDLDIASNYNASSMSVSI